MPVNIYTISGKLTSLNMRYMIVNYPLNKEGSLTELRFFAYDGSVLAYTTTATGIAPTEYYWTYSSWNRYKLNDNNISYTNNASGSQSTAYFSASRHFFVDFGQEVTVQSATMWVGAPEGNYDKGVEVLEFYRYTGISQPVLSAALPPSTRDDCKYMGQISTTITAGMAVAPYSVRF